MAQLDPRPDPLPPLERRQFAGELRTVTAGPEKIRRIAGWASRYNVPVALGAFDEIMTATAFDGIAGSGRNIKLLLNHRGTPLASVRAGSLILRPVPGEGLEFSARLPEGAEGEALWRQVEEKNLDGASVGFVCTADRWEMRAARPTRLVERADVFEVSLVGTPAMAEATVETRTLDAARDLLAAAARTPEARAALEAARHRTYVALAWAQFADALNLNRDWRPTGGRE